MLLVLPKSLSKTKQIDVRYNYDEPYEILDTVPEDVKVRFNDFIHKYDETGSYSMSYQKWFTTYVITIQIDDPYPPVINGDDVIEVNKGMRGYDFYSHFVVTDYSKVVVKLNLSHVDFDHEGIYPASIEAKDASNNIAKKEFQVRILDQLEVE